MHSAHGFLTQCWFPVKKNDSEKNIWWDGQTEANNGGIIVNRSNLTWYKHSKSHTTMMIKTNINIYVCPDSTFRFFSKQFHFALYY